ncbi:MAG: alkene reductase [Endozoicomonadaceae bacterium]|nr:alkene reductase [Endozoicomonadaceae bacterium]
MFDASLENLLKPIRLAGQLELKNRIVMAPMTRRFASQDGVISSQSIEYYGQRSRAGLIVTEGTLISEKAMGYGAVPGIFSSKHIEAWKPITDAVHKKNGVIFLQLWHCGRVSHPSFHQNKPPISASAIPLNDILGRSGLIADQARAASIEDIQEILEHFYRAACFAKQAEFDGVEIHAGNGYLIDQFLHACTNKRLDEFGGNVENNTRFCLQVVEKCIEAIGAERVGIRLSPGGHMANIVTEPQDRMTFEYLLQQLDKYPISYIHTGAFDDQIVYEALGNVSMSDFITASYPGQIIASGGYSLDRAINFLNKKENGLVSFGRPFIANYNLIDLIEQNKPWKKYQKNMLNTLI